MRTSTPRERAAVAAVATQVSATVEAGGLRLSFPGGREAAALVVVEAARDSAAEKPRLRFDRVVLRLLDGLGEALGAIVPDGTTVVVTVTAPIRLPGRTEAAIVERVRDGAADVSDMMHGNAVRLRRVAGLAAGMPKLVGFVHNPGTDPATLLDMTESLLRQIPAREGPAERWLVIADDRGRPMVEAYRAICGRLAGVVDAAFLVCAGRVETLVAPQP